jgi:hypothetical protein
MTGQADPSRFPIPVLASFRHPGAVFVPGFGRSHMTIFDSHREPAHAPFRNGRLVRSAARLLRVGLRAMHRAIVTAKVRRLERELLLRDLTRGSSRFPQAPLILGDKWDF